jgi:hypothetical protein
VLPPGSEVGDNSRFIGPADFDFDPFIQSLALLHNEKVELTIAVVVIACVG